MQSDTTVVSIAAVFFKKAAVAIAIHGQKTLHWQLSKVLVLSGTLWYVQLILRQQTRS